MLHACAARFDVMENIEIFWKLNKALIWTTKQRANTAGYVWSSPGRCAYATSSTLQLCLLDRGTRKAGRQTQLSFGHWAWPHDTGLPRTERERNKVPWQEPPLLFRCSVQCVNLLLARDYKEDNMLQNLGGLSFLDTKTSLSMVETDTDNSAQLAIIDSKEKTPAQLV